MALTPTLAALFGSIATAIAIFGGGLAVEAYKWRRDRIGMALALAGAIDALLGLIETRDMTAELAEALMELDAGRPVEFSSLIRRMSPLWDKTQDLGSGLVADLRTAAGYRPRVRRDTGPVPR